jgi:hypothetical protein
MAVNFKAECDTYVKKHKAKNQHIHDFHRFSVSGIDENPIIVISLV